MNASWPQDPMILLSVVNTRLRDEYASLEELCAETGMDREELTAKLAAIGYRYDETENRFR